MAGDYLYISGQGAAKADGTFPDTAEEQVEQCSNNVKAIVEGAGLTLGPRGLRDAVLERYGGHTRTPIVLVVEILSLKTRPLAPP